MRSQERHELKTNDLGKLSTQAGIFFEKYGNQILIAVVALILIATAVIYWMRSSSAKSATGWTEFAAAGSAAELADVADQFPGTPVGAAARLSAAESHLRGGMQLMFTDRSGALDELNQAQESFEQALESEALPEHLRPHALFGLAQTREALSDKDTGPAVEVYERLVDEYPESVFAASAKQRIEALKTERVQDFYAWFHSEKPKPSDIQRPTDGLPSGHPLLPGTGSSVPPMIDSLPLGGRPDDVNKAAPFPEGNDEPAEAERPQQPAESSATEPSETEPSDAKPSAADAPSDPQ